MQYYRDQATSYASSAMSVRTATCNHCGRDGGRAARNSGGNILLGHHKRQADGDEQHVSNDYNDPQLMGEAKTVMHYMFYMMANQSSDSFLVSQASPS